ncbi:MAG: hypothetical protein LBK26_00745 [Rickettsiales bacterium]|jgi:tetratricopeptide (TPR) repeat protein|nr:hypothetical protein [Rickettsiales bacterium]
MKKATKNIKNNKNTGNSVNPGNVLPSNRILVTAIAACGFAAAIGSGLWTTNFQVPDDDINRTFKGTDFGNFLAMHHAMYADDFDMVEKYSGLLSNTQIKSVQTNRALSLFVAGKIDDSAGFLEKDTSVSAQIAYAAYLIKNGDWDSVYKRFRNNNSQILAPIRIWAAVAAGKSAEALRFIDSIPGNDSWRSFIHGQVYAVTGKTERARQQFLQIPADFLNLNDYLYLMAFYQSGGFDSDADELRILFTERPGGLYALNYKEYGNFGDLSKVPANLRFALIQSVSHSPVLASSSISLLLLRMAEVADEGLVRNSDPLNYYMGAFFYNSGNYDKANEFFNKIGTDSMYQPFILLKDAEKAGNFNKMRRLLTAAIDKNPLFMPAILKLVDKNLQKGRKNDALKVVNRALKTPNLTDMGRAFLLTLRARVYRQSGDLHAADADITLAFDLSPRDTGVLTEQAQIWAESGQNLDEAYQIAMILLKKYPSDISAWDTLAMIVWKKEGLDSAILILQKISKVAQTNSQLFEHLGDMYIESGDVQKAHDAYTRGLELSDDGQTSESVLKKKIRKSR